MLEEAPLFLPLLPNRVFRSYMGGKLLDELQGKPVGQDTHCPEEWIASTTLAVNPDPVPNEGLSQVRLPDGSISYLRDVIQQFAPQLLGQQHIERFGTTPDILVKFLDSAIRLAIQAHPLPEFSRRYLGSSKGKTEAWIILSDRQESESGYVYLGFQHAPTPEEWKAMLISQDILAMEGCFEKIPVRAGDVFIVKGSVPHAIGPGLLMVEIQEPSDFVVRCERERGGYVLTPTSQYMNLTLDQVGEMFNYQTVPAEEVMRQWKLSPRRVLDRPEGFVDCLIGPDATDMFAAHRIEARQPITLENHKFLICVVVGGNCRVETDNGSYLARCGSTFILSAACKQWTIRPEHGTARIITASR